MAGETMPTDTCQYFYDCKDCGAVLKPKARDCCVFCSYAPHRDEQYEAEQAFALDSHANEAQLHIHLTEDPRSGPLAFTCKYYPIRQTAQMP